MEQRITQHKPGLLGSVLALILVLLGVPPLLAKPVAAVKSSFSPASFINQGQDFLAKIQFPEQSQDGVTVVRGAARISKGGTLRHIVLYRNSDDPKIIKPYEQAVTKAFINPGKIKPAIVNGEQKSVWFNFSVLFNKTPDAATIELYPTLTAGLTQADDRTDPQRYSDQPWPSACTKYRTNRRPVMLYTATSVDEFGVPSNSRILAGHATEYCKQGLIRLLNNGLFIPAKHGDQFIPATYIEAWY